jgi:hypothetical protein
MNSLPLVGVVFAPQGAAGLRDIFVAAKGLCRTVMIFRTDVAAAHPDLVNTAQRLGDAKVWDGTSQDLAGLGLDGLTTFHDDELDPVDDVVAELGLPSRCANVTRAWDKWEQRRTLNRCGASALPIAAVDSSRAFQAAVRSVGLPAVLKPRRGVGGAGVAFVMSPTDIAYQLANRCQWPGLLLEKMAVTGEHPSGVPWLGGFVSVETVSVGHRRRHLAVFDKTPAAVVFRTGQDGADAVRMTGDITPSQLPDEVRNRVLDLTTRALDALGVRWRVTHTELWVSADSVQIIEVNGRVGGHLARLLRLLGGPDLVRCALMAACGREPEEDRPRRPGFAAGLFPTFLDPDPTVRSSVSRLDLRRMPGVVGVDEVAERGTAKRQNGYRAANITLLAPDADTLTKHCRAAYDGLAELFRADGALNDPWQADRPESVATLGGEPPRSPDATGA